MDGHAYSRHMHRIHVCTYQSRITQWSIPWTNATDDDRMDELYTSTLKQISASKDAGTALAIANDPSQYALSLAEHVTGSPVVLQGYDPLYDAIIKVAPPVALSVEGVRQGHAQVRLSGRCGI